MISEQKKIISCYVWSTDLLLFGLLFGCIGYLVTHNLPGTVYACLLCTPFLYCLLKTVVPLQLEDTASMSASILCRIALIYLSGCISLYLAAQFWRPIRPSWAVFVTAYPMGTALLFAIKSITHNYLKKISAHSNLSYCILLAGDPNDCLHIKAELDKFAFLGIKVTGILNSRTDHSGQYSRYSDQIGALQDILNSSVADCIFVVSEIPDEDLKFLSKRSAIEGLDFICPAALLDKCRAEQSTNDFLSFDLPCGQFYIAKGVSYPWNWFCVKRLLDFAISFVLVILFFPAWIIIPLLVRLDSPGPAFFRQERVGKHGRKFTLYKFRSMVDGAEALQNNLAHLNEMDGPAFKIRNDPRMTKIGRVLRKTSLDELPQLFNVLFGDISLVGPRPPIFREVVQYKPWERKKLAVIQGITCLWQISGRNDIKFDEWMKLDILYIETWNLKLDLEILFKTIPAVFLKRGAR